MDLNQLLADKRVQVGGLAAAAGVGAYVLIRRKQSGGAAGSTVATVAPAGGGVAQFDSTGTDVANWLGNYSGNLQNQLDAYSQQLTDTLSALKNLPTQAPASTAPRVGGTWLIVGDQWTNAGGGRQTVGRTARDIAGQIYGHPDWWNSIVTDPVNAGLFAQRGGPNNLMPGDAVFVAGVPH